MSKDSIPHLRFLCFGVGAIGTYVGGSLALANQQVVFIEFPDVARKIQQRGLYIRLKEGEYHIKKPDVVSSIDEALNEGHFDVAILAVKSYDTQTLLKSLEPHYQVLPPFLCLQNGVENESMLASELGTSRVIPGTVTSAVGKKAPGDITLERLRGVGVSSHHPLAATLVKVLDAAGLRARMYDNAKSMKWSKMLTNLFANASSAILDMTPEQIISHPGLYRIEIRQLREALQVMDALRIPVIDLPGTPVRVMSGLVRYFPPSISQPLLYRGVGKGRGKKMPSFHIDLYSGRGKSEVDYLNGAVVRFGSQTGIQTPVNHFLNQTLLALIKGELDKEMFAHRPEKLLVMLKESDSNAKQLSNNSTAIKY